MNEHPSQGQSKQRPDATATAKSDQFLAVSAEQPAEVLPGSMNDGALVRQVLIQSIRRSSKSRTQIAEEISSLCGYQVTETSLNKFTAESRTDYRWPGELDRAFCRATGDDTLLKVRAELAGYRVIGGHEIHLLELGREYLRQQRAAEEISILQHRLAGVTP